MTENVKTNVLKLGKSFLRLLILTFKTKSCFQLMFLRYIFEFYSWQLKFSFPIKVQVMVYIFIKWDIFEV